MYAAVIYLLKGKRHFKKDYYIRRDGRFNEVKKWINQSNQWPVLVLKHNQNLHDTNGSHLAVYSTSAVC